MAAIRGRSHNALTQTGTTKGITDPVGSSGWRDVRQRESETKGSKLCQIIQRAQSSVKMNRGCSTIGL